MDPNEILLSKGGGGGGVGGSNSKSGEGFIDRSKVRILLCDNDAKSSQEVLTLLCKCSYQVTSVRSPRQVIDALNAEGPDIDIILSEVDLPMAKGLKMLKHIMRDKDLRRIPVIMMSAQDEVSLVVKCLRLGAADYLVKPLRTNELLNLWTHMWRRRRMLGLAEKNIINYEFDLVASDPSDANTNSTTLFSDDTDDKSRKSGNLGTCVSTRQGDEIFQSNTVIAAGPSEIQLIDLSDYQPDVPRSNDRQRGQITSGPKKSELKIGQSSAFFTYVKSSMLRSSTQGFSVPVDENTQFSKIQKEISLCGGQVDNQRLTPADENVPQHMRIGRKHCTWGGQMVSDIQERANTQAQGTNSHLDAFNSSNSIPDSFPVERPCVSPMPPDFSHQKHSKTEGLPEVHMHPTNNSHHDVSGYNAHSAYPYYISGVMNQVVMSSAASIYQKNLNDVQNHPTAMLPQYNHMPHYPPHMPGMASFPYYPVSVCLQPGQMPTMQQWPSYGTSSSNDVKISKVDRREAALLKFRQKRKERCFDKKIRYVNRKRLAERRPRVRGQFVRKVNGINVDLNGQPTSTDFDDDEEFEDEEEDQNSTPDYDSSVCSKGELI